MTSRSRILIICALLSAACNVGCNQKPAQIKSAEGLPMLSPGKKMIPRCIGRYLVDLPEDWVLDPHGGQEIEGITVNVLPMPEAVFDKLLLSRRAQLERNYLPGLHKYPMLKEAATLQGNAKGLLFDRAENDAGTSRMGRTLELLAWRGEYRILATVKATDTDFPEFANDAWIKESKTTTAERKAKLLELFSRIRGRHPDEIPAEKGACIINGFVSRAAADEEVITFLYHLKGAADVSFLFNTDSTYTRDDTLTSRSANLEPLLGANQGRVLRSGSRIAGSVKDGEELLYRMLSDPNAERKRIMTYKFVFEANNATGSATAPLIRVDFSNGEIMATGEQPEGSPSVHPIANATLSESEAISLWDAVIPTLRPRPGAF